MSESDLDDALSDLDLGDIEGGGEAEIGLEGLEDELSAADPAEEGGEGVELDGDLQAALDSADAGGGEEGGESVELDGDLQAALDSADTDAGGGEEGGEGLDLGDDLQSALDSVDVGPGETVAGAEDAGGDDLADALSSLGGGEAPAPARPPAAHARPAGLVGVDAESVNVEFLLDIRLHVTFEVGRAKMLVSDLLTLGQGSVVELHRLVGDELDLLVNGKLVAKGEVVVVNEKFGCRIASIVPPEDRIKYLGGL